MANDPSLPVRKAVIDALRAQEALTAKVPADRVFGQKTTSSPVKPFVRYGMVTVIPKKSACGDWGAVTLDIHAFSDQPDGDEAAEIAAIIANLLDGAILTIDDDRYECRWTQTRIVPDTQEADVWHGIASFAVD